ncbi:hypothetical protein C4B63_340g11 [Trypanosoma cruzi]|uniref:Uncharacterized protein n=1 Tax=Trypanosoma cruzi TaxID=5693 RepID=A0A2V2UGF4_TRYCR|nr:hypothetical protein C4B63_340g11 [Trypanosoma cruzi]
MQYVVDRLYDARDTLRESFQPGDGDDAVTPFMVPVDGLLEQAVSFLGENYREKFVAVLKSSGAEKDVCPMLHLEKWLNSMYIPETRASNVPPFSLSKERDMWRGVKVEELQSVLQLYRVYSVLAFSFAFNLFSPLCFSIGEGRERGERKNEFPLFFCSCRRLLPFLENVGHGRAGNLIGGGGKASCFCCCTFSSTFLFLFRSL